jgi:hypothetical protein
MTDNYELVGSIRRDLQRIADNYDEALDPVRRAAGSPVKGSKEPPLPVSAHILDVRADAHRDLMFWARFLLDEVRDVNGDPLQHGPTSVEVGELVPFVSRWVDWLLREMPDDGENLATEASKHARALSGIVLGPKVREWVSLGDCPLTVARDGESVPCEAPLRAYPGKNFIACKGCGHEDTLDWWRAKLVGHRPVLVGAKELVDILLIDLKVSVDADTVRQWAHRGKIARSYGPRRQGQPWLFDWARVEVDLTSAGKKSA